MEVAGSWGGGGGCPWPLHIPAGPRGAGGGDQALEPLAHLPPPGAKWGIPPPRARVDGDPDGCPPLGSSGSPRYPPQPLPRKVHFLQCVQRGPLPGAVEPAAGVQWGWPPLPRGGAGGQLHRLFLPNRAGTGLRPSPRQAAGHTGFGAGAGPTTQDTLEKVRVAPRPWQRPGSPQNSLPPSSHPCPPQPLLGCWPPGPCGTYLPTRRSPPWGPADVPEGALPPGSAHLVPGGGGRGACPSGAAEMSDLGRRRGAGLALRPDVASPESEVRPCCCLYLLFSWLGGFIFMGFFSRLSFFCRFVFLFAFFFLFSSCVYVSVSVFSARLGVGRCPCFF